ncbi:DNA mismatch repair protein MutS, partial [candidate division WWE3 bacterium]|nr:DNA mismatch repair protein MutS [candidate division WWE3 bacterium]
MVSENDFSTPMMKQYAHIKAQYPDTLLFFRLGDFYELFMEDAETGAEVLDITLTARDKGSDGKIPMCGVPFHAVDSYISRLVAAGYKVAICEQISSADDATGIVERDVVRVVTPSTILDENAVPRKETNYLMVLDIDPNIKSQTIGVAFVDLGTSDFQIVEIAIDADRRALEDLVTKFTPKECIISPKNYENVRFISWLRKFPGLNIYPFGHWREYATDPESYLRKIYEIASVEGIGLKDSEKLQRVTALAVGYLNETQKGRVHHLSKPQKYHMEQYLEMDSSTIFNLELFHTIREGDREGSLLWLLDKSKTAMGGRLLRHWIVRPSRVREELVSRHDFVEYMFSRNSFRTQVQDWLESVLDIERILGRLSVGTGNARDLVGLRQSLVAIKEIIGETNQHEVPLFKLLGEAFTTRVTNILSLIEKSILDEPSALMREGNMIRDGYSEALDELRSIKNTGQGYLDRFLEEQKQITGIPNLKVGSNKVFGFYLEVSKSHTDKVPPQYVRKQTLVNAERYITQELKEYEDKVLGAEEKISELEYELVQQVIEKVLSDTADLFTLSKIIGKIDVLTGFAEISERNNYVKPMLFDDDRLVLEDSRHPVIEQLLEDQSFVPNDVSMDSETRQIILLTGPNMAGKSTYIRQVAICALIAHLGCFVPCRKAEIGIVDKLFT